MYPLLILREEIACLIVLAFLLLNSKLYKMGKDHGSFMRMCFYAVGHVIFDIITVLTVNNPETVPAWFNYVSHIIFYLTAILYANEFFCYIVAACYSKTIIKRVRLFSMLPIALYLALLPVLPIIYLQGNGTKYSYGMAAYVGYALAMIFFLASGLMIALHFKRLASHVRYALIPMLAVMMFVECVQIAVPELLFTGGGITIITVGFFFSLENPVDVFKQKLLIDALTGVKSRHSYELDIKEMEKRFAQNKSMQYGIVFCDINNLKGVNNNQGHFEGDAYIGKVAQILVKNMEHAEAIYRMGGDEFMAVYCNKSESVIQQEIQRIHEECERQSRTMAYAMGVAIGFAVSGEQYDNLREVLRVADYMMYRNKAEMKKQVAFVSADGQRLNIMGLTDRVFDAFASTGDREYITICNLSTNVSRWSKSAVDYFGLPGEFLFDCLTIWMEYIHPDDRANYRADISAVFSGNKEYHNIEYRVRNKDGEYVMCTCRGKVLKGKYGEPDLFAATLVNHGIVESIDPVTGLHNEQAFLRKVDELIDGKKSAGLLIVSIFTFNRINMLYGYTKGNEVLRQFVAAMQEILHGRGEILRMDGIKFLLCVPDVSDLELAEIYREIQVAANHEISLEGITIPLRLAGGAYVIDEDFSGNALTIRNHLSYAHEHSKHENHGKLILYGKSISHQMGGDYALLTRVHQDAVGALSGFYLHYQPILRMDTEEVVGAEALLRWRNELYGEVSPKRFVPWLENDPCFFQMGRWILYRALSDAREILKINPDFVINVNVTMLQLEDERFNDIVLDALRETGFPPHQLCLELTERSREMEDDCLESQIRFFRGHGIRIALDDVGTGFSSLSLMLKLPVDEIKLDKSFITDIRSKKVNQALVHAIIEAVQTVGYQTCLEGIEDDETYRYLKKYGATYYQGYNFSRPVPIEKLKDLLER